MDLTASNTAVPSQSRTFVAPGWGNFSIQFFPPTAFDWNVYSLPVKRLPTALAGLRILHLTDFHFRRTWPAVLDQMLDRINEDLPDLLLFTGDFVDNKRSHQPAMPMVRRLVSRLKARIGCFGIHGNHDNYRIGSELGDVPMTFLDGKRQLLNLPGGQIEIIGLPGHHRRELRHRLLAAIPAAQENVLRIVLSHFPDHLRRTGGLGADLFLCGHTHGGQICLPGGTALLWHDSLPRRFASGVHRVGDTWVSVSRGFGFTGIPLRAYCTPELVEIRCNTPTL